MSVIIEAKDVCRDFRVKNKSESNSFKSFLTKKYSVKRVVDRISFTISEGDFVGYLGPNGAGKSTTIKMLSGVLVPSSGYIKVDGKTPHKERKEHSVNIGVIFGHRTQLWWDLPLIDSFQLLGAIYHVPKKNIKKNIEIFSELLDLHSFLHTPVRQLSLGQRMRGDIAASLIHEPKILFLDEPTIGLDIIAKEKIQQFLKQINQERKVTILMTTHNLDDIEKLCKRVIFIDEGQVLYDGKAQEMVHRFGGQRYIVAQVAGTSEVNFNELPLVKIENNEYWFEISDDTHMPYLIGEISKRAKLNNFMVKEPNIENIIRNLYSLRKQGENHD